jgi:hypothetical protein
MEDQPQGMERRMVHRLLECWRNAREDHELPPLDDVFRQDLGDMVPNIYVLKVSSGPGEPVFERVGGEGNLGFLLGAANCKVKDA